ncbi:MAG: Bug family tripartite tricarboxylate transporter substrate binding protein [Pseudorhodoplanes sp.]
MRTIGTAAAAALVLLAVSQACAQSGSASPQKVEVLVGYGAGTGVDSIARFYADRLQKKTGVPHVVVNKVGVYGNLAAQDVVRANPDGSTILITPNPVLSVNMHLLNRMPFDPQKDLAPVTTLSRWGMVLLVNPEKHDVKTVGELVELLRKNPDKLSFASGNFAGRASGEILKLRTGTSAQHVPYRSVPAAVTDLLGGQVDFMFADVVAGLPHVKSGKLRGLAVTTPQRLSTAPDIPTTKEAGIPDFELVSWFAVALPARTPRDVVDRIATQFNEITNDAETRAFFEKVGGEPFPGTPDGLAAFIKTEIDRWGDLVKKAGIEKID